MMNRIILQLEPAPQVDQSGDGGASSIPNSLIGHGTIINETCSAPRHRIRAKVGCAYGSDLNAVRKVPLEAAAAMTVIIATPKARVRFQLVGDSILEFELLSWIKVPELRDRTLKALNLDLYERFQGASMRLEQRARSSGERRYRLHGPSAPKTQGGRCQSAQTSLPMLDTVGARGRRR